MKKERMILINVLVLICGIFSFNVQSSEIKNIFEQKYNEWKEYNSRFEEKVKSTWGINKPLYEIVKLGIPALPFIIEKIQKNPEDFQLGYAVFLITKKQFEKSDWVEKGKMGDAKTKAKMYVNWWYEGRKQSPEQFEKLYTEWKSLKAQGKEKEAKEKYERIKHLGIVILPNIIEKIEHGETEFIPIVSYFTDDAVKKDAKVSECVEWWKKNKEKWTLPPVESEKF